MKRIAIFFIIATSVALGAGLSQVPTVTGVAGSWSATIKANLQPGDDNQRESTKPAGESQNSWEPQALLLIAVGLIGLGLKRRQRS